MDVRNAGTRYLVKDWFGLKTGGQKQTRLTIGRCWDGNGFDGRENVVLMRQGKEACLAVMWAHGDGRKLDHLRYSGVLTANCTE